MLATVRLDHWPRVLGFFSLPSLRTPRDAMGAGSGCVKREDSLS